MRSTKEVEEARQEALDRVWLDRHRTLRQGGVDVSTGDAHEASLIAEHGDPGIFASEHEEGLWEGRLEALRWVLGDEWGNRDS